MGEKPEGQIKSVCVIGCRRQKEIKGTRKTSGTRKTKRQFEIQEIQKAVQKRCYYWSI